MKTNLIIIKKKRILKSLDPDHNYHQTHLYIFSERKTTNSFSSTKKKKIILIHKINKIKYWKQYLLNTGSIVISYFIAVKICMCYLFLWVYIKYCTSSQTQQKSNKPVLLWSIIAKTFYKVLKSIKFFFFFLAFSRIKNLYFDREFLFNNAYRYIYTYI